MDIEEAIVGRQSVRAFLADKPVPRPTIEKILRIASRAPSGSNIQPWHVWVITGEKKRALTEKCLLRHRAGEQPEREYNYYPVKWTSPYIERRRACGWGLYNTIGIKKGDAAAMSLQHGRNYEFFDAPVGLFFTIDRHLETGSWIDTGMFIQSVMIAARSQGLETCPQVSFCSYYDTVLEHIGAPDEHMLICGMSLGYADPDAIVNSFRTSREDVSVFAHFLDDD